MEFNSDVLGRTVCRLSTSTTEVTYDGGERAPKEVAVEASSGRLEPHFNPKRWKVGEAEVINADEPVVSPVIRQSAGRVKIQTVLETQSGVTSAT